MPGISKNNFPVSIKKFMVFYIGSQVKIGATGNGIRQQKTSGSATYSNIPDLLV